MSAAERDRLMFAVLRVPWERGIAELENDELPEEVAATLRLLVKLDEAAGEAERLREKLRKISRIADAEVLPESASDHHLMSLTYALSRVLVLAGDPE